MRKAQTRIEESVLLHILIMLAFTLSSSLNFRSATRISFCHLPSSGLRVRHQTYSGGTTRIRPAYGTSSSDDSTTREESSTEEPVSVYRSEGLFAVNKPLDWTSNDVVSYIRGILERDARQRGANPVKVTSRKNKCRIVRVGHGGTLDPLASGVLVIGVGKGTKELQSYLSGPKRYLAQGEFGFETTTLDMEGNVTKTAPFDHVTLDVLEEALPSFTGKIQQIPPIFSAIRKGGKKLYEEARKGKTADDLQIDPREVQVYRYELVARDEAKLPRFDVDIECGGGTYVRALIRDVGYKLNTVATMTSLQRTQQGQFTLDDVLEKPDWTSDNIYEAIDSMNAFRASEESSTGRR